MRLEWPLALLALLVLPAAALVYRRVERRRTRFAVRYTNVDLLALVAPAEARWRRLVAPALLLAALLAGLLGVARPFVSRTVHRERATVVLLLDTSGSMVATDVHPSRLAVSRLAARRFIARLPSRYRVGVVTFASEPQVAMPVTADHELAIAALRRMTAFGGTSIGDAIQRAVEVIAQAKPRPDQPGRGQPRRAPSAVLGNVRDLPPSAIVLLSDGAQNLGRLQPSAGAAIARRSRIPVYTIALGTPGGALRAGSGPSAEALPVPPDPRTLASIAKETGGRFYRAETEPRLDAVYRRLASSLAVRREYREVTSVLLAASAALLLAATLVSFARLPRLP